MTQENDSAMEANRLRWNEVTPIHERSAFYDVEGFRAGNIRLHALEQEELGDVSGKSLLHLQCHFGLDTLSWARLGAEVTGVDFSEDAIALARSLVAETGVAGRFVQSNVYDLPQNLDGTFDIVFTSYGAIHWLPDLARWAELIEHFLKPGGTFYIAEFHPLAYIFDDERDATGLDVVRSYFNGPEPVRWEPDGDYAETDAEVTNASYEWTHTLSDVVNALIGVGLRIEFLHEHPFTVYEQFTFTERHDDGYWRLKDGNPSIPLMFSLRASKAAG